MRVAIVCDEDDALGFALAGMEVRAGRTADNGQRTAGPPPALTDSAALREDDVLSIELPGVRQLAAAVEYGGLPPHRVDEGP